ncbi:MAG: ABC transporter ATP-binding protein [Tissierellia bacterium]|nr:ABC transporter ATP-binding protein [Tissierellia bacterium]
MNILEVKNLSKHYGKGETLVKAIDDVSFKIDKGDFVAIIGPSGSGKSTLMHLIGGVDQPTAGKVFIDGQDIYQLSEDNLAIFRRRQVGLIYQFYNLIPILNVEENLKLPLLLDKQKIDQVQFDELVSQLGLSDRLNHLPNQLSGGQQQRVSIGRSLIYSPALVLADEPTGNLDSEASQEIVKLLEESNQKYHQTIIVITHDERIAMRAKRVLTMKDGQVVRDERVRR